MLNCPHVNGFMIFSKLCYPLRLPLVSLTNIKQSNTVVLGFYVFNNDLEGSQKNRTVALRYSLPVSIFFKCAG